MSRSTSGRTPTPSAQCSADITLTPTKTPFIEETRLERGFRRCYGRLNTMTSTETAQSGKERVISRVRFTSELCGYGEIGDHDVKQLQSDLANSLEKFFRGRVLLGNKFPRVGVQVQDSKDPVVGTACVGSIMVYLGVEGEDMERVCNECLVDPTFKKNHPITWWELVTEESEKRRAEEKARRKEYSKKLMAEASEKIAKGRADARSRAASSGTQTPENYVPEDDGTDPDDLF